MRIRRSRFRGVILNLERRFASSLRASLLRAATSFPHVMAWTMPSSALVPLMPGIHERQSGGFEVLCIAGRSHCKNAPLQWLQFAHRELTCVKPLSALAKSSP